MSDANTGAPAGLHNLPPPFDVAPYRPDGGYTSRNSAILLGSYLLAGTLLGVIGYFISQAIWLIVIFPVLIGFILGGIGIAIVKKTKIRNPMLAGVAGFLGGCLAMLAMHYAGYLQSRADLQANDPEYAAILELDEAQREKALDKQIDDNLKQMPPELLKKVTLELRNDLRNGMREGVARDARVYNSFWGFMDEQAVQGVQIKGTRHGGKASNLGYVGSYIYWGVEVLLIAGIALAMVWSAARMPFCIQCETWKTPLPMATLAVTGKDLDAAVRDGEPWRVLKDGAPLPEREAADLVVDCCPNCQENAPIEMKVVGRTWNKKNEMRVKEYERVTYPGLALPVLVLAFQPPPGDLASAIEHEQLPPEGEQTGTT